MTASFIATEAAASAWLGLFMNTCYVVRSSRPAGLFSFGLLDGLPIRLRRPYLREAPAGFGLRTPRADIHE